MATNEKQLKIALVLSAVDKATQVINDTVNKSIKKLESLQKRADAISQSAFSVGRSAGAMGLAVGAPLLKMAKDAEAAATAQARLEQVFRSMGDASGVAAQKAAELASSLQFEIAVDDETIKATMAKLATFENVIKNNTGSAEVFERATMAAFDLAAAGFGEATGNAVQLGKALNDPIKGMNALTRAGVTFTAQEQAKIKKLVETGKMFEAQQYMLAAIEKQVGGVAKATANDTDKMKIAFGQVSEQLGMALLPMLNKITNKLVNDVIPAVTKFVAENQPLIERVMKAAAVFAALMLVLSVVAFTVGAVAKAISIYTTVARIAVLTTGALSKAVLFANNAFMFGARVYRMTGSVMKAFMAIMRALNLTILMNPFVLIAAAAVAAAYLIYRNWDAIKEFFVRLWDNVKRIFFAAFEAIKAMFFKYHPVGIIIAQWDEIMAFLVGIKDKFFEAGANIVSSIKDGIMAKAHEAVDAIKGTVQKMRDFLPFSPAKTGPFKDLHRVKIVETIAQAVKPAPLVNAMRAATVAATMAMTPGTATAETVSAAGSSNSVVGGTVSVNYAPVITFAGNADSPEIRENFTRMLKEHERELLQMIKQAQGREQRRSF